MLFSVSGQGWTFYKGDFEGHLQAVGGREQSRADSAGWKSVTRKQHMWRGQGRLCQALWVPLGFALGKTEVPSWGLLDGDVLEEFLELRSGKPTSSGRFWLQQGLIMKQEFR